MRKERKKAGVLLMAALCMAMLFSTAEAATGQISARVTVKNGELRLILPQGQEMVYGNGEADLQLSPATIMKSSAEVCIIKISETQFILDKNDSLAYESENGSTFMCMSGAIEAICGNKTRKLVQGEVVALNSLSEADASSNTATRARDAGVRFTEPFGGILPYQGGPFSDKLSWLPAYAQSQTPWVNASPYW